jgi:hypothetical protein
MLIANSYRPLNLMVLVKRDCNSLLIECIFLDYTRKETDPT